MGGADHHTNQGVTVDQLTIITERISQYNNPPVDQWNPASSGTIDIRIDTQGRWFHQGDEIKRARLVKLFASILWFDEGQYYLVTPVEKLTIDVEDTPFVVQSAQKVEGKWVVSTNTDEQIIIESEHPVMLKKFDNQLIPYVLLRFDLWARVNRSVYYQWVSEAIENDPTEKGELMLSSGDYSFVVAVV